MVPFSKFILPCIPIPNKNIYACVTKKNILPRGGQYGTIIVLSGVSNSYQNEFRFSKTFGFNSSSKKKTFDYVASLSHNVSHE